MLFSYELRVYIISQKNKSYESISYFLHLRWSDERLKWDSNRLEVTVVDQKLIWLPYLRQFFAKDKDDIFEGKSRQVKIFSNGTAKGAK